MRLNFEEQHPFLWLDGRTQYPMVPGAAQRLCETWSPF